MRKLIILSLLLVSEAYAQAPQTTNKPDRVGWFQDLGFGMFIHWNVDVSLGVVISHSLAGASNEYVEKYIKELPAIFNPKKFKSGRLGKTGEACRNEIRGVHYQASFGFLYVQYKNYFI